MTEAHQGGCLCGAVRYKTIGNPDYLAICHCSFCRRFTGSAFNVVAAFDKSHVEIVGEPFETHNHRSTDHGRVLILQFCPRCGTTFGLNFERFPTFQAICSGTFDDPTWLKPERHIFTKTAMNWMPYPKDVELFEEHSLALDGSPLEPIMREPLT